MSLEDMLRPSGSDRQGKVQVVGMLAVGGKRMEDGADETESVKEWPCCPKKNGKREALVPKGFPSPAPMRTTALFLNYHLGLFGCK